LRALAKLTRLTTSPGAARGGVSCNPGACRPGRNTSHQLLDRQEIAIDQPLRRRRAQQIGRVEGGERLDLARAGVELEPAAARLGDAFGNTEQRLRRRPAQAHQQVGIGELDLAADERQANRDSCGVGVRLPGGRHGTMLAI
jgi:hypothetical protein